MKKTLSCILVACSLVCGVPGVALAAAPTAAAAAQSLKPQERVDLALMAGPPSVQYQQNGGDRVMVVGDGGGRWHRGYGYGYGIGGLVLTALIVSLIIVSQAPYR